MVDGTKIIAIIVKMGLIVNSVLPKYMFDDYNYTSQFESQIKWIINNTFLNVDNAPLYRDLNEVTDYTISLSLATGDKSVGVRIRSNRFIKYSSEVSFGYKNPQYPNILSEFDKIQRGFPKYYLYGFSNRNDTSIDRWVVLDMDIFRYWQQQLIFDGDYSFAEYNNICQNSKTRKFFITFGIFNYPLTPIDNRPLIINQYGHY